MLFDNSASNDIGDIVKKYLPPLSYYETIYKDLHQHPELSLHEKRTASIAAKHLGQLGYEVTTGIGGYGVTGVLRNGSGKKVLLRADMDALPVQEETGLPYASKARGVDPDGKDVPLMHACGHDMHVTSLMAAATLLHHAKAEWKGTLICLFQPNEERAGGAAAMVADGLYDKVPVPDVVLGQHVNPGRAGSISPTYDTFMAAADSLKVTIFGRGGHGSQPEACVDPILIAGYIVVRLQSIVSRMVAAADAAVVTVGSIHGGQAENIISDEVEIKINIRTFKPEVRTRVLAAIKEIITSECRSAGAPRDPEFTNISSFPLTINNNEVMRKLQETFEAYFGKQQIRVSEKVAASEDVSNLATPSGIPLAYWFCGGTDQKKFDDAVERGEVGTLPVNHSSKFAPAIDPTLKTMVQTISLAALRFLT